MKKPETNNLQTILEIKRPEKTANYMLVKTKTKKTPEQDKYGLISYLQILFDDFQMVYNFLSDGPNLVEVMCNHDHKDYTHHYPFEAV